MALYGWPRAILGKIGAWRRSLPAAKQTVTTGYYKVTWRNPPRRAKPEAWRVSIVQVRTGNSWRIEGAKAKELVYRLKDVFADRQDQANAAITETVLRYGQ